MHILYSLVTQPPRVPQRYASWIDSIPGASELDREQTPEHTARMLGGCSCCYLECTLHAASLSTEMLVTQHNTQ